MERWACVDIPLLALQILLDQHADWRQLPVAVVDRDTAQGVVLQCNRNARDFQIKPGLRYAAALSLNRDLRAAVVDEAEVVAASRELLDQLRDFSPFVEAGPEPGLFWLRVTGLDRLFGGFDVWAAGLFEKLREQNVFASITVGWTRFGTFAIARSEPVGWRLLPNAHEEHRAQGKVGLDLLGLAPKITEKLAKLAVLNVEDLLALPPSGIRKRFGPEAAALWRLGQGVDELPLQPVAWEEPVQASFDFDDAMWDMTQLTFLLKSALHPLLLELAGRHLDLRELDVQLRLENGDTHDVTVRPSNPTLEEVRIVELCRLRLERVALPSPIIKVELEARGVPSHRDQSHLFRDNARRDLQVANHALARLAAEYPDAVFQLATHDRHLPESKFTLEPFDLLKRPEPKPDGPRTLVRRLLGRPLPLPRFREEIGRGWMVRDLDEGVVEKTYGPYRLSGGWWLDGQRAISHIIDRRLADSSTHHVSPRARYIARDGEFVDDAEDEPFDTVRGHQHPGVSRAYWFAETTRGDVFWVYWDYRRQQWFLHGVVE